MIAALRKLLQPPSLPRPGRFRWYVTPAGRTHFGDDGPDLDGWIRDGCAAVIKQGTQRTVYRVSLPGGDVFAKRCRVNGLRVWLREHIRKAKARLEFDNALRLRELGLPAVEPLAWAHVRSFGPGDSIFVTRCEEGAIPLQRFLHEDFPKLPPAQARRLRRETAVGLGVLMARLHDAGVAHPDPHPGNLLVAVRDGGPPVLTLIDLHAIRFGRPLSWRESLHNLVLFNRWFQLRASRADRFRFWQSYVSHRTTLPTTGPQMLGRRAKIVERRSVDSNARFWVNRFPRYVKSSRHVHAIEVGDVKGHSVSDFPAKFVERLALDPDAPFRDPTAPVLKVPTVIELLVPTPDGPRPAIYKRFRVRDTVGIIKNLLRPSAAMRSWLYGHNLLDRNLPTARPLCVLERRRGPFRADGYLLTEIVPDAKPLHEAVASLDSWRSVRAATDRIGALLRDLHEKRVSHRDLKASNIMMTAALEPVLIDLVGVTPGAKPIPEAKRKRDVARLAASFRASPHITRADKLRVLRAYLAWGLIGRRDWKLWWRAIDAAIQRKQAKNTRRGRPLA